MVNICSISTQQQGLGKWEKIGVFAIQKVVKTGNIGKKNTSGRRYRFSMQKVNLNRDYLGLSNACSYDVDDVIGRAD